MEFVRRIFPFFVAVLLIFVAWEGIVRIGITYNPERNSYLLPPPEDVLTASLDLLKEGDLFPDIAASLKRIVVGFSIAALSGLIIGLLLSSIPRISTVALPIIELFRPIPPIAWIPIAVLWLGIGDSPAYFIVFLGAFFPIFTNIFVGINSTDEIHIRAARTLGASKWMILRTVVLPSAVPYIITGGRIGLGTAWICVITAELVGAQSGLGYMIQLNRIMLQTDRVIVGMILIGLIGFLMNQGGLWLEKALMPWHRGRFESE